MPTWNCRYSALAAEKKTLATSIQTTVRTGNVIHVVCRLWCRTLRFLLCVCISSTQSTQRFFGLGRTESVKEDFHALVLLCICVFVFLFLVIRVSGVTTLRRPCGIEYCGCVCVCFMLILMFCSFACNIYEWMNERTNERTNEWCMLQLTIAKQSILYTRYWSCWRREERSACDEIDGRRR